MADSFNENLSMFLTPCRESALRKLSEHNAEEKRKEKRNQKGKRR